jgi:hypothetical protein
MSPVHVTRHPAAVGAGLSLALTLVLVIRLFAIDNTEALYVPSIVLFAVGAARTRPPEGQPPPDGWFLGKLVGAIVGMLATVGLFTPWMRHTPCPARPGVGSVGCDGPWTNVLGWEFHGHSRSGCRLSPRSSASLLGGSSWHSCTRSAITDHACSLCARGWDESVSTPGLSARHILSSRI